MPDGHRPSRHGELTALIAMCTVTVLVTGLVAAINLAIPMLAASPLAPNDSELLWIVDAYVIVFACLVIPGGAAGDRFGRKGTIIAGLSVFAVGAIVSALAPSVGILLTGRIVTGLGAALVLPNTVGILIHATAPERRARALATWGVVSGLGGLFGNLGGGAILATGAWQALFWVIASLALACTLWIARGVRRSTRSDHALDPAGTLLLVAATVTLLVGIIEGPERGWADLLVIGAFALSAVLWVAWVLMELRVRHPVLDPRLFRIPLLTTSALGLFALFFGSFGLFYVNASLLGYSRGFSALLTGVAILPLVIPMALGGRFAPALARRLGLVRTLLVAFLAVGGGLLGLSGATHASYAIYAIWLFVVGIGFALAMPVLTVELNSSLPPHQAGVSGGLQSAATQLGSAIGVALVGSVLGTVFTAALPRAAQGERTVAGALSIAPQSHEAIIGAYIAGANAALQTAGAITLVAGVLVVLVAWRAARRRGSSHAT